MIGVSNAISNLHFSFANITLPCALSFARFQKSLKRVGVCSAMVAFAVNAIAAAEVIPPNRAHYVNDYAGLISQSMAEQFDRDLAPLDRATSNQVVVAIFPTMPSDADIAAY